MKIESGTLKDLGENSIVQRARQLNRNIEPERDLWPAIAEKINEIPQQEHSPKKNNSWMPMAMAASLMIAIGAISFAGYTYNSVNKWDGATDLNRNISSVQLIEQPYLIAKASYLTALATSEKQISSSVRDVLRKNLLIIDNAAREIRHALKNNPNDPFLTEALILTRQKELELLNQVTNQGLDTI